MTEAQYQKKLIKKLEDRFPGCTILKADVCRQGFPDLLILWNEHWASLEVKLSLYSRVQPNQRHYVQKLDDMSFADFIYPENEEEVLNALQQAFESPRRACVS